MCVAFLFSPLIMALIFGVPFCSVSLRVVFIIPFMVIRKYSGGYHAQKIRNCLLISGILLTLCFLCAEHTVLSIWFSGVVFYLSVCIGVVSPVDSENRRLTDEEVVRFRKNCREWLVLFGGIYLLLCVTGASAAAVYWGYGLILTALLQIPCVVKRIVMPGRQAH
ncbi:MAG: accessory gene regulator B family protein [Acetatifactor sp.]